MTHTAKLLAVVPARAGSKGLPGKNIRPFFGLPLIAHSILFARQCAEIDRLIVSTDSSEIAGIARDFGAEVPFLRPLELARSETPMWPVLRHALLTLERQESMLFEYLLLLDPTSPARETADVREALRRLIADPEAMGILTVSQPSFNPIWHCVISREGYMADLFEGGEKFHRRQDLPPVYRINGALYMWRASFVRKQEAGWRGQGKHLLLEIPDLRAISIDDLQQFEQAEAMVKTGLITLPWSNEVRRKA